MESSQINIQYYNNSITRLPDSQLTPAQKKQLEIWLTHGNEDVSMAQLEKYLFSENKDKCNEILDSMTAALNNSNIFDPSSAPVKELLQEISTMKTSVNTGDFNKAINEDFDRLYKTLFNDVYRN